MIAVPAGVELGARGGLRSLLWVALLLLGVGPPAAAAGSLTARLVDQKGRPVAAGVVIATPAAGAAARPAGVSSAAVMDQVNEAFVPEILPVVVGTEVDFPNQDDIRHHVYSFSDAKKFELPLYKGTPAAPVVFDTPGEVVLGCNIHDHMRGYILVVDSPYFATAGEDGAVQIRDLPFGDYEVKVWHPRQKKECEPRSVAVGEGGAEVEFALELKPALRLRSSSARGKKY